jgi:ABC-type multidrug transport system ATPase subunit
MVSTGGESLLSLDLRWKVQESPFSLRADIGLGSWVGVSGPSGCGKSTLLKCLVGAHPWEGSLLWKGSPWKAGLVSDLRIGWAPQSAPGLNDESLESFLFDGFRYREESRRWSQDLCRQKLKAHLDDFGLGEVDLSRSIGKLSGGQRQRASLVRALASQPNLLLLDECLSAVDHELRLELWKKIRSYSERKGATVFLVSHDPAEIALHCAWHLDWNLARKGVLTCVKL